MAKFSNYKYSKEPAAKAADKKNRRLLELDGGHKPV